MLRPVRKSQAEAPADGPCDDTVSLVVFVPCRITKRGPVTANGRPAERSVDENRDHLLDELRLWDYSPSLKAELREILPHRLTTLSVPPDAAPKLPAVDGCVWRAETCRLERWDIDGIGLGAVRYVLVAGRGVTWRQVGDSVLAGEVQQQLFAEIEKLFLTRPPLAATECTPLWVQAMFVVRPVDRRPLDQLHEIADALTHGGERLRWNDEEPDEVLWVGDMVCAVSRDGTLELTEALGRVIAAQTATWAAAIDLERQLSGILKGGSSEADTLPLNQLEERGFEVLGEYDRVQRFRAGVDSVSVHLALPDREVWERVDDVWPLKSQLGLLDLKIKAAEHVYGHMATTLATRQARFLNGVVLGVTCLSLATFLLTVWQFTRTRFDRFDVISLGVAVLAGCLAAAFYYYTHLRTQAMARRSRMAARRNTTRGVDTPAP
jgi:hypothetical protein